MTPHVPTVLDPENLERLEQGAACRIGRPLHRRRVFIELRTELDCSCELAFTLSLDLDLELRATARFGSRIVGGRRGGRIGPGETVTWRLRQFGIPLWHTSVISEYEPPIRFVDEMVRGVFAQFRHEHRFLPRPDSGCTLLDTINYRLLAGPVQYSQRRLEICARLEPR